MREPVNLERYLQEVTSEMSRHDAFVFVSESLPSASGSWMPDSLAVMLVR